MSRDVQQGADFCYPAKDPASREIRGPMSSTSIVPSRKRRQRKEYFVGLAIPTSSRRQILSVAEDARRRIFFLWASHVYLQQERVLISSVPVDSETILLKTRQRRRRVGKTAGRMKGSSCLDRQETRHHGILQKSHAWPPTIPSWHSHACEVIGSSAGGDGTMSQSAARIHSVRGSVPGSVHLSMSPLGRHVAAIAYV